MKARERLAPIPIRSYDTPAEGYKRAAVIALLTKKEERWHLVFMQRTGHPDDKHAGQISFPGGKKEDDEDILSCALRETYEEIGINQEEYEVLGQLSELYIPVSNFLVFPFLAVAKNKLTYTLEKEEVQNIIEIPLEYLRDDKNLSKKDIIIGTRTLKDVPYFNLNGKVLWGATAIITSEILALIKKHQSQLF